jgi:hypothetical protein
MSDEIQDRIRARAEKVRQERAAALAQVQIQKQQAQDAKNAQKRHKKEEAEKRSAQAIEDNTKLMPIWNAIVPLRDSYRFYLPSILGKIWLSDKRLKNGQIDIGFGAWDGKLQGPDYRITPIQGNEGQQLFNIGETYKYSYVQSHGSFVTGTETTERGTAWSKFSNVGTYDTNGCIEFLKERFADAVSDHRKRFPWRLTKIGAVFSLTLLFLSKCTPAFSAEPPAQADIEPTGCQIVTPEPSR